MSHPLFDGNCPGYLMAGRTAPMALNSDCRLECPSCHNQVMVLNGGGVVWHELGQGQLESPDSADPSPITSGLLMFEHNENWPRGAGPMIQTAEHLATCLYAVKAGHPPPAR